MTNILVTGASGFFGSHLALRLVNDGHNVIAIYNTVKPSYWLNTALKGCNLIQCDILNRDLLKRIMIRHEISEVYHLASQPIVSYAHADPYNTINTNVMGTVSILETAKEVYDYMDIGKSLKVINITTDKVFGEKKNARFDSKYDLSEIYGASKIASDVITRTYNRIYGSDDFKLVPVRLCNLFGYDPLNLSRIVPNSITRIIKGGSPVLHGKDTKRQYIYIWDAVNSLIDIMRGLFLTSYDSINICPRNQDWILSNKELIESIIDDLDVDIELTHTISMEHEIKTQSMVTNLIKDPAYHSLSIKDCLRLTFGAFLSYRADWDKSWVPGKLHIPNKIGMENYINSMRIKTNDEDSNSNPDQK